MSSGIMKWRKDDLIIVGEVHATNMLDSLSVSDFGSEVVKVIEKYPGCYLLLSFEQVEFLSSAALSELIRIHNTAEKNRGVVRLCGISPDILKVLTITKLDQMFSIHPKDDVATALDKFRRLAQRAKEEREWADRAQKSKK